MSRFFRVVALVGLWLAAIIISASAQQNQYGNVAALLDIGVGARPLGMGNAFVGLADDENAGFYNPAALAFLTTRGVTALYTKQFELVDYGALGLALPSFGAHLLQLYAPDIPIANAFGNPAEGVMSYVSRAGLLAVGLGLMDTIALGSRLKFYAERSGRLEGFGWAIDPAMMLDLRLLRAYGATACRVRLGAIFENAMSRAIRFSNGHAESWVPSLRLGGSLVYELPAQKVKFYLSADVSGLPDRPLSHVGAELWLADLVVRAGFDGGVLTAGTSIHLEHLRLDWAYAVHTQLPHSNRLSVTFRF